MALKTIIQFPIFTPTSTPSPGNRRAAELHFWQWNNGNAKKFLRREKLFDSPLDIANNYNPAPPHPTTFKSTTTPSGKFSKYSKKFTKNPRISGLSHPAFRSVVRPRKIPNMEGDGSEDDKTEATVASDAANIKIDENGVAYEIPDAPFAYQYSYTETPKVKPVKIREPLVSPFGPETMGRPWTGRKPLPPSKKKLPEFDSFQLPPPHKKGVKPVQAPGPFLEGIGPRYVKSREEILGEPLTKAEVEELIKSCVNSNRQLNIGRDGLTHNMLDNIHAHWKRRRVCKIKCKGVCTVDMDNVRQQLEEKTGGKVIHSKGGLIYLFRGRNYNFRTRPHFPLMLWRPVSPVYPRLIKRVPEGLTLEEANEMRNKGRNLTPICKLAKNGVYWNLAKNVREAFEACELVRISCQGLNASDYKKIGGKLKDLVPCVLISFENEHILMWRGPNWKSSLLEVKDDCKEAEATKIDDMVSSLHTTKGNAESVAIVSDPTIGGLSHVKNTSTSSEDGEVEELEGSNDMNMDKYMDEKIDTPSVAPHADSAEPEVNGRERPLLVGSNVDDSSISHKNEDTSDDLANYDIERGDLSAGSIAGQESSSSDEIQFNHSSMVEQVGDKLQDTVERSMGTAEVVTRSMSCIEGVLLLRMQAVDNGSAIILDDSYLDSDVVYQRAVALAKSAPPGPVFKRLYNKSKTQSGDKQNEGDAAAKETIGVSAKEEGISGKKRGEKKIPKSKLMKDIKADYLNVAPQGSLRVDELAKLLS